MSTGVAIASQTIGFVSFGFTLLTAIRVFWTNFDTFISAPHDIHDTLSNLKQSLYEERHHLRRLCRRRSRSRRNSSARRDRDEKIIFGGSHHRGIGVEESLEAMLSSIRHMISRFKELERPFLMDHQINKMRRGRESLAEDGYGDDTDTLYGTEYRPCGFRERFYWIKKKGEAYSLLEGVARLELRRISMQFTNVVLAIRDIDRQLYSMDERIDGLDRLEDRLSRVVGVRRV